MPKHSTSVFEFKSSSESTTKGKVDKCKKNRNNNWLVISPSDSGLTFPAFDISHLRRQSWEHHKYFSVRYLRTGGKCFSQQIFFIRIWEHYKKNSVRYLHDVGRYCSQTNIFQSQMTAPQISFSQVFTQCWQISYTAFLKLFQILGNRSPLSSLFSTMHAFPKEKFGFLIYDEWQLSFMNQNTWSLFPCLNFSIHRVFPGDFPVFLEERGSFLHHSFSKGFPSFSGKAGCLSSPSAGLTPTPGTSSDFATDELFSDFGRFSTRLFGGKTCAGMAFEFWQNSPSNPGLHWHLRKYILLFISKY